MPKFKKEQSRTPKSRKISDDVLMLESVRISALLGGFFLALSLLFNGTELFFDGIILKLIPSLTPLLQKEFWVIFDNIIKVAVILFTFFFMMISVGNYKEFTGKPVDLKEIVLLVGLSLAQTFRNLYVFIFTLIGLVFLLVYLYLIQES